MILQFVFNMSRNVLVNSPATFFSEQFGIYVSIEKFEVIMYIINRLSSTGFFAVPPSLDFRPPEPVKFTVDHPFLYLILFEDKILFAGTFTR